MKFLRKVKNRVCPAQDSSVKVGDAHLRIPHFGVEVKDDP